ALESPEVRHALERQTAGLATDVSAVLRRRARQADDSSEAAVRRELRRPRVGAGRVQTAGIATRGTALAADTILAHLVFVLGGALVALFASLFGTLRPMWLVD